jgi:hypothetical protein
MLDVPFTVADPNDFAALLLASLSLSSLFSGSLTPTLFTHAPFAPSSDMRAPLLWLALAVPAFASHDSFFGSSHDLVARAVKAKVIAVDSAPNRTATKGKTGECTQAYIDNKKSAYCKQSCPPNQWPLYREFGILSFSSCI